MQKMNNVNSMPESKKIKILDINTKHMKYHDQIFVKKIIKFNSTINQFNRPASSKHLKSTQFNN